MFVLAVAGATSMSIFGAGCGDATKVRTADASVDHAGAGGDGPAVDGGAALDDFFEQVAKAGCAWQFRCCTLPEIDVISQSSYLTESECVAQSILQLRTVLAAERFALLEGRLTVDARKLDACVQQVTTRRCTSTLERDMPPIGVGGLLYECQDPFLGQTPVGARCTNLRECVSGSVCSHFDPYAGDGLGPHSLDLARLNAMTPLGAPVSVEGICVADQKEGQQCAISQQCQVGLYCRRTDFVCARPAREGDRCLSVESDPDTLVGPAIVCGTAAAPLVCVADVCRRLPHEGEPCLDTPDDATGLVLRRCDPTPALDLVCVGAALGGHGVCKKAAGRGATCGGLGIPPCSLSLQCAVSDGGDLGTCQDAPGEGEPCFSGSCRAPAVCYLGTLTCVVPPPSARAGSICKSDLDCTSLSCEFRGGENSSRCVSARTSIFCMGAGANPAPPNIPPPLPP